MHSHCSKFSDEKPQSRLSRAEYVGNINSFSKMRLSTVSFIALLVRDPVTRLHEDWSLVSIVCDFMYVPSWDLWIALLF